MPREGEEGAALGKALAQRSKPHPAEAAVKLIQIHIQIQIQATRILGAPALRMDTPVSLEEEAIIINIHMAPHTVEITAAMVVMEDVVVMETMVVMEAMVVMAAMMVMAAMEVIQVDT